MCRVGEKMLKRRFRSGNTPALFSNTYEMFSSGTQVHTWPSQVRLINHLQSSLVKKDVNSKSPSRTKGGCLVLVKTQPISLKLFQVQGLLQGRVGGLNKLFKILTAAFVVVQVFFYF